MPIPKRRSQRQEEGNVLLLSLFVLSSILIGSTAISAIILRDLRSGQLSDSGHAAFYSAESGVEGALYALRRAGATPSSQNGDGFLANGAGWSRAVTVGEPVLFIPLLKKDDFAEINLYNPDDLGQAPGIESLAFSWQDNCGDCTSIELSYTQWPAISSLTWPPGGVFAGTYWKFRYPKASGVPWLKSDTIAGSMSYRLRLRALYGDLVNLDIRAFADDAGSIPRDLPSRLFLRTTGRLPGVEQTLSVAMQRAAPLSNLFNFVVFSEEGIVK